MEINYVRDEEKMVLDLDTIRMRFLKYTRMAYELLPKIDDPKILDVGCGSGVPTLELAKLSNGNVIGIDIDKLSLEKCRKKLSQSEFKTKVTIKQMSMVDNDFPDDNFDLIWSEGAFHIIGFKKAFMICHRVLKKGGFLVLFEAMKEMECNMDVIISNGFTVVDKVMLPDDIWITDYFNPLKVLIKNIDHKALNANQIKELKRAEKDLKWVENATLEELACAFYIFMKN